MNDALKQNLIKLGTTNPELRPHIRPILAGLPEAGPDGIYGKFREGDKVQVVGTPPSGSGAQRGDLGVISMLGAGKHGELIGVEITKGHPNMVGVDADLSPRFLKKVGARKQAGGKVPVEWKVFWASNFFKGFMSAWGRKVKFMSGGEILTLADFGKPSWNPTPSAIVSYLNQENGEGQIRIQITPELHDKEIQVALTQGKYGGKTTYVCPLPQDIWEGDMFGAKEAGERSAQIWEQEWGSNHTFSFPEAN